MKGAEAMANPALKPEPIPSNDTSLKIVRLEVSNVKRLRAVKIETNGAASVIVGGQNAQGKTSLLDSIEMAIGGARTIPEDPIRHGAAKASIVVDLGDLLVERTFSKTGTTLVVRDRDGAKMSTPQAILDRLCSKIAFDPLAFMREDGPKQNEILRRLVGLDFSQSERQRSALYDERTKINRDAKATRAQSEGLAVPADTPDAPVQIASLVAQISQAHAQREQIAAVARARDAAQADVASAEKGLADAEKALREAEGRVIQKRLALRNAKTVLDDLAKSPDLATPADVRQLEQQVAQAEATNRNVERKKRRDSLEAEANQLDAKAAELTAQIDAIVQAQAEAIAAASFPVPGLGFGENGPTFKGVPLQQASGAERLRVSVAIGLALNPRLKVLLLRDASLLDEKSLALVAEMAADAGAQVWLERVGSGDPGAVIIQDGQVLANDNEG
jgi:DNA repair exonuclease SbcCD ATPase subunit